MRRIVWCLALGVFAGGATLAIATSVRSEDQQPPPPNPVPQVQYSCVIPYDVTFADPKAFDRQRDFDVYSWNTFLALNWPADTSDKGTPPCNLQNGVARDCNKPLPAGDYGPTVWETFKPDWAVFRGNAQGAIAPAGWNCPLDPLPGCDSMESLDAAAAGMPVLRMIIKDGNTAQEFLQAGTFAPLIDQNNALVRYEMRMNEDEFNAINAGKLWDSNNQTGDIDMQPVGSNTNKTFGPMEVKAAWRILTASDDAERFHSRSVQVAWPNPAQKGKYLCKQYTMGLVGLHIAHKSANAPQWIWSTFEQVDNYSGPKPSFTNVSCPVTTCPPNAQPTAPSGGWSGNPTIQQQPPTQVVVAPGTAAMVLPDAAKLNAEVQQKLAAMGSVWQYYALVSTQWPSVPFINGKPAAVLKKATLGNQGAGQIPHVLANSTMETYLMGPSDATNTSSCMYCHSLAFNANYSGKSDFSYLFQEAYPAAAQSQLTTKRRLSLSSNFNRNTAKGGQPTRPVRKK
jgi:hypothetical protein